MSCIRDVYNGSSVEGKMAWDKSLGVGMTKGEFEEKVAKPMKASIFYFSVFN